MILFDAINQLNKPAPVLPGMKPLRIIYGNEPWPNGGSGPADEAVIRQLAHRSKYSRSDDEPVCFDLTKYKISLWGNQPDRLVEQSLDELCRIADVVHRERPGLRFGFYNAMPTTYGRDLNFYAKKIVVDSARKLFGRGAGGRFEPRGLADRVDFIAFDVYAVYDTDAPSWIARFRKVLGLARRLYQRRCYVFICPFHTGGARAGQPVDYFDAMLDTSLREADGTVIWTGTQPAWDDNAAWWRVTREFVQ